MSETPYEYFCNLILKDSGIIESFLVRLKIGDDDDAINVLLMLDQAPDNFIWETDWWEGEKTVELVGYIPLSDIMPPYFEWFTVPESERIWRAKE